MRVLFIASELPCPPHSGARLRNFHLLRRLGERHEIVLVAHGAGAPEAVEATRAFCAEVHAVPPNPLRSRRRVARDLLAGGFSSTPFLVRRHYAPQMADAVRELAAGQRFDLAHCDAVALGRYVADLDLPKVMTVKDIESVIWRRYRAVERNPAKRFFFGAESRKLARYEREMLRHFRCVAVSEVDRRHLESEFGIEGVSVVPNGVDLEHFRPSPQPPEGHRLVYTGAMDYRPNDDAMLHFIARIYPSVKAAVPDVTLSIVGQNPSGRLRRLAARDASIEVTGRVEDVRPYLERGAVYVVPLRIGGGTRLKILEALATGTAVVSTGVGAEGLDLAAGEHLLRADGAGEFAAATVGLLRDGDLRARLAEAGRRLVVERMDWRAIAEQLDAVWEAAAGVSSTGRIYGK